MSISWIEAPYDWAMYAQFPPAIPRMPSWWPLNMTWGGLPSSVPIGYMSYFVIPAADRRGARQPGEREVRVAAADRAADRRPRRRVHLGVALQRHARGPARRLLLRPGDPGPRALRGHQAPVPALRRGGDGPADDGVRLPPRPDRRRRPQHHRGRGPTRGRRAACGPALLSVAAVVVVGHVLYLARVRAPPRHEAAGRRDRRADRAAVPRRREPAAPRRRLDSTSEPRTT